jgi:DNA/RNA-binding domain of Phe-tRNA-synthetase-like protein
MKKKDIGFNISDAVRALGLQCVVFTLRNIENRMTDHAFEEMKTQFVQEILADLSLTKIVTDPILQGFRQLHEAVRCSNKKYVSSPETLLRGLFQTGRFPHINLLVDIYNLISVKTRLSLGAHDVAAVCGNIHLRLTTGEEHFWPLGSEVPKPVGRGEYAYVDDENNILCRLEVRQADRTKIRLDTTDCFCIVQGNPATESEYLRSTAEELITLMQRFCGGQARVLYAP